MSNAKATNVAMERVKSFVDRLERMEEERKAIGSDIRDIYTEAKGVGFDAKTLRWLVSERKVDAADRAERDALRATYAHALGLAVELVEVNGLSLRQAEKRTGISKSSIQRALAVPAASHGTTETVDVETGEITETVARSESPPPGADAGTPDEGRAGSVRANPIEPTEPAVAVVARSGSAVEIGATIHEREGEGCCGEEMGFEPMDRVSGRPPPGALSLSATPPPQPDSHTTKHDPYEEGPPDFLRRARG